MSERLGIATRRSGRRSYPEKRGPPVAHGVRSDTGPQGSAHTRSVRRHRRVHHTAVPAWPADETDLARKYHAEIHANEIVLLAYYIAAINIELAYHDVVGGGYQPYEGLRLPILSSLARETSIFRLQACRFQRTPHAAEEPRYPRRDR